MENLTALIGEKRTAQAIEHFGDTTTLLNNIALAEAGKLVTTRQAAQLRAVRELALEINGTDPAGTTEPYVIHTPADAAALVQYEMGMLDQEHFRVILLNVRKHVLLVREIYKGSVDRATIRISEVYRPALMANAPAIIAVHNHPSADPTPSPDDIAVTRALVKAGELLDIELLDHLIISRGEYVSLKKNGLGFN